MCEEVSTLPHILHQALGPTPAVKQQLLCMNQALLATQSGEGDTRVGPEEGGQLAEVGLSEKG